MKTLKIIAGLVGLLVILALAGVAYVAATFDPDTQRARIIELVKEKDEGHGRQERHVQLSEPYTPIYLDTFRLASGSTIRISAPFLSESVNYRLDGP